MMGSMYDTFAYHNYTIDYLHNSVTLSLIVIAAQAIYSVREYISSLLWAFLKFKNILRDVSMQGNS